MCSVSRRGQILSFLVMRYAALARLLGAEQGEGTQIENANPNK